MPIQGNERHKIEKSLQDISNGNFDERTVDSLFMGLRAYSGGHIVFRDIADSVAHNDARKKGTANEAIKDFYLHTRFLYEYTLNNKALDLSAPFPKFIKRLLIRKITNTAADELRQKYGETQQTLASRMNNLFIVDEHSDTVRAKGKISAPSQKLISDLFSMLVVRPAYTQKEVVESIINVLGANSLEKYENAIIDNANKLSLCTLVLLHNTLHEIDKNIESRCLIASETHSYPTDLTYVDENDNPIEVKHSFGSLGVMGSAPLKRQDGNEISMAFRVFETDLIAEEWCESTIYKFVSPQDAPAGTRFLTIDFDTDIGISKNFKLVHI
jgi:hypothetical protein